MGATDDPDRAARWLTGADGTYDATTQWRCAWADCPAGGALGGPGQRHLVAFLRHVCYGHGPTFDPARAPRIFDTCKQHNDLFRRSHGLDADPHWVARFAPAAGYGAVGEPPADGPTRITRSIGNREA